MSQRERMQNLIIVAAVDGYAHAHGISALDAFDIFQRHDLFKVLRDNYETLHTQSLDESARFADDYISRQMA